MKAMAPILATLLALLATGAEARGIDCAKVATKLEKAICDDPVMRDYDTRIAAAYARAVGMWDGAIASYVKNDQQQWLTSFQAIERLDAATETDCVLSDTVCVRDTMRRRVDDIESGTYVHSGVYRSAGGMKLLLHPGHANGYRVRVYDPAKANEVNVITLEDDRSALWDGPQSMVSTMGDANGLPLGKEDGCTLRLLPEALAIRVFQKGSCQGRSFEGTYNRLLDETLRSYELELY
jgi:uncharacterized protein YecT (DUF1311 family)